MTPTPAGPAAGSTGEAAAGVQPASLTQVTARGFLWSFGGGVGQALLSIVSIVVLGHLLTPTQFGASTAAGLVVGLSALVSQLGVGAALVQRKSLEDHEVSAAVVFSVTLSLVLSVLVLVLTPWLNPLIGLPRESTLLRLMSATLLLGGLAAVPQGLLQRRLQFRVMTVVDVLAAALGTIGVSAVLALQGFGAFALVWGSIAGAAITAVGYGAAARPPLRPAGPRSVWRSVRPLVKFGSGYSLSQLGNWMALNGDNFVTTNVLGPTSLGVYSRAYRLLSQPANLIGGAADKVLFPAMSKVRGDGERLRNAYIRATSLVALVALPLSVLLCVLAPEFVHLMLGPNWDAVVFPLRVFAVVLVPRATYKISGSLTRATGAVYGGAWRQWLYAAEVVAGCTLGARWGVNGVAVGASAAIVLHFLVMLHFSARISHGLMGAVLRLYTVKHLPLAVLTFAGCYPVAAVLRGRVSDAATLLVAGASGAVATLLALLLLRRLFADEVRILTQLVASRRRRAAATP